MSEKFIGKLKWKYVPTKCATCGPDLIYLKCKHSDPYSFAIYKSVCDYAEIDAVQFYDKYRSTNSYVGIEDEFYFYIEDEFMFVITDHSDKWEKFDELVNGYYDFELEREVNHLNDFNMMVNANLNFKINDEDLKFYPVDMVKIERGRHVVIREFTEDDREGLIQSLNPYSFILRSDHEEYLGNYERKTVHVKKGDKIPYREYDLEPFFDPYKVWPYRTDLSELLFRFIDERVNYDRKIIISFYSYFIIQENRIRSWGNGCFIYAFNDDRDDYDRAKFRSENKELELNPFHEFYIRTNRESLHKSLESLTMFNIEYNDHLDIRKSDREFLRYRIEEALEKLKC